MHAVVVLGMHNSGTSVLVQMLGLLGGYVGEPSEVLLENSSYPLGYGERKDVIQMNNLLLASQDTTCFRDAEKFSCARVAPVQAVMFRAMMTRLSQIIETSVKSPQFFALKDPRLCLTLGSWREFLKPPTRFICIVRDPRDVAESLFEKKKIPREHSMRLWEHYNTSLLQATEGCTRLLLSYDDLLHRPLEVIKVLQGFLGTQVAVKDEDIRHERHTRSLYQKNTKSFLPNFQD